MKNKSILLVEDDADVKDSIVRDFKKPIDDEEIGLFMGNIRWTDSVNQALALYRENYFDLIILDLRLGQGGDGLDFLKKVRESDHLTPILVLSGQAEVSDHHAMGQYANTYFFNKSFAASSTGNPRLERCLECLREGEKIYAKTHRDFYLPPIMATVLFDKEAPAGSPFGEDAGKELIRFLCDPHKAFNDQGIYGWFDKIGETVSKDAETLLSQISKSSTKIDMKQIIKRIRGDYSLKTMEDFFNMDPYYREHFSHQFHVFLIGHLIYNTFKDQVNTHIKQMFGKYTEGGTIDTKMLPGLFGLGWFLTALFHDCGNPVQYFQKYFSNYFKKNFHYRFLPRLMRMEDLIISEGLEPYFGTIVDDFWPDRVKREEFRLLLIHQFKNENHAIHSAIALRKLVRFNERNGEAFSKFLKPVYSAISLHDWEVWGYSEIVQDFLKNNTNIENKFEFHYPLDFLASLEKNPLLHILLIADSLQNWGRGVSIKNMFYRYRLELIDIRKEKEGAIDFLTFEMNVRAGKETETHPDIFCKFCQTFKTLAVILGSNGLPIKIVLNKGLQRKSKSKSSVEFRLGIGEKINCYETEGCPMN